MEATNYGHINNNAVAHSLLYLQLLQTLVSYNDLHVLLTSQINLDPVQSIVIINRTLTVKQDWILKKVSLRLNQIMYPFVTIQAPNFQLYFPILQNLSTIELRPLACYKTFFFLPEVDTLFCARYVKLTYSMQQSPSWEANLFSASQEAPRILWIPKVHYRTRKRPPPVQSILPHPTSWRSTVA